MAAVALALCVYLLSVASQGVVGDKVYTVVANQSASSCPGNQTECSLMYYAAHPDEYFREDNTTFHFLPGQHQLVNSTLVMSNISNLTLYGTDVNESIVVCRGEGSGGFSFYNITNLTVLNLSLYSCSHKSLKYYMLVALEVLETHSLVIDTIDIHNTVGVGLSLTDLYGDIVINNTRVESSKNSAKFKGGNFAYHCSRSYMSNKITHYVNILNSFFRYGYNIIHSFEPESSGIYMGIYCSANIKITLDNVNLIGNHGINGGNILIIINIYTNMWTPSITFLNSWIYNGSSDSGGGLCMIATAGGEGSYDNSSTILRVENTKFENNTASYDGGAVFMKLYQNSQAAIGEIVYKNCTFIYNKLVYPSKTSHGGIAVHIATAILAGYQQHKMIYFLLNFSDCTFKGNLLDQSRHNSASPPRTGALYGENVRVITLNHSKFIDNICSGIIGINSHFLLHGENEIRGNRGLKGGGIFFCANSIMHLHNGTKLSIIGNHANMTGGGIYVDGECSPATQFCFFQVDNTQADDATLNHTQVHLINNTASAGSAIYGGLIDRCFLVHKRNENAKASRIFNHTFHIQKEEGDLSVISSDPLYVGFCKINSSTTELNFTKCPLNTSVVVKPGQIFVVHAVIMGQRYGLVSGDVGAKNVNSGFSISSQEYNQYINTSRRYLTYTLFSEENRNISLELVAEDYYSRYPLYQYKFSYINIEVQKCPLGFVECNKKCSCLADFQCDVTKQIIYRSSLQWIGYTQECHINNTKTIILYPFCPLGYCLDKNVRISATIDCFYQDVQCAKHRTGLLCGKCKQSYSLGFGSSQCLAGCNTAHRYLQYLRVIGLVAVCAVAGILLVVLLTLLNLTVAEGTLNGLIFYANIVQVNLDLFFPSDTHARPWTTFITWLNLDFGVTVCFYDGMDAYVKTWLQFIFPLYIWIISGGIVYFSRKSRIISKLAGKNSVKVLATLFLISFGKLIRTVIAAGFFTNIKSYDGTINISVWLLDANVHYLHGKHTILFVVSVVTGVVALLYALILTFIQCLRRAPNNRMCGWVQRLKPLLDAYTGPYKNKYHFWTGFLLLVRIALFISFAVNFENNPTLNFTLIIAVSTLLIIGIQKGVYRNKLIGLLESSMYVNLILFSAFTMLSMNSGPTQKTVVVCVFGGWAFLTLVGITVYHGYKNWFWKAFTRGNSRVIIRPLINGGDDEDTVSEESDGDAEIKQELKNQALNAPHLRESLIGSFGN